MRSPGPPLVHHPEYVASGLPAGHRFTMQRYAALAALLKEEGLAPDGFHVPEAAPAPLLQQAHAPAYVRAVLDGTLDPAAVRRIGFPLIPPVVRRSRLATGGTLLAARLALLSGLALNTAGGSHHARRDAGAGFCVFNDVAVAAARLLDEGVVGRILIVDLDVHAGDGTASSFAHDSRVFTLSVHCASNWPLDPPASTMDVGLAPGTPGGPYLEAVRAALTQALARFRPDLVFYLAGVDVHRDDRLGKLALTDQDIAARERMVLDLVRGRDLPLACVLAGGYDPDPRVIAGRNLHLFRAAAGVA